MAEHYTLNTVEVMAWCNACRKNTPHHVACRRLQYCKPCFDKPQPAPPAKAEPSAQISMFDEKGK